MANDIKSNNNEPAFASVSGTDYLEINDTATGKHGYVTVDALFAAKFVQLTQAAYDALGVKDPSVYYVIVG